MIKFTASSSQSATQPTATPGIKFLAKLRGCVIDDPANHRGGRSRWPSGYWTEPPICDGHMAIWKANVPKYRSARDPLWWTRSKKEKL